MRSSSEFECYFEVWLRIRVVNFPEISTNISKSLEVRTCIIFIRIADIPGSCAENKLFFLNKMHEDLESCLSPNYILCYWPKHSNALQLEQ